MKETKVYVDELPKSCYICPCFDTSEAMCSITGTYTKFKQGRILEDCPLKSLHEYKKELMEKVLEKTKTFVRENTYICGGNATRDDIITSSSYNQALRDVLDFMETLQKEFEK